MRRPVLVTGAGLVSCRGEGEAAHLAAFREGGPPPTTPEPVTGYPVHPAPPLDWDRQIPKRSDQRQMEGWQRLGCYAAGLALDAAGASGDPELKSRMQMIVAAGGGERDYAVDGRILDALSGASNPDILINERLVADLRPTLFLAQLSNLLAGNIAIVHGVAGASRTFMGEEASGVDALRIAEARVAAGQADVMLVGGSFNGERPDLILIYELGGFYWREPYRPVRERPAAGGGFVFGSGAAFLVLEAAEHAERRGARPLARLDPVVSTRTRRGPGDIGQAVADLGARVPDLLLSAASGVAGPTEAETEALASLAPGVPARDLGDLWGELLEANAPAAAALGAFLVSSREAADVAATVIGHRRGEGLLRLRAPG